MKNVPSEPLHYHLSALITNSHTPTGTPLLRTWCGIPTSTLGYTRDGYGRTALSDK